MEVQGRYKGVEGICRGHGEKWEYKDDTREQRVYVEEHGDRYGSTKTTQGMGLDGICKTAREQLIWKFKEDIHEKTVLRGE